MRSLANRIVLSLIVIGVLAYLWEFDVKPLSGPLYTAAVSEYKAHHYDRSLQLLNRAYNIDPNDTAILSLFGWDYLKIGKPTEGIPYFERSLRLDPSLQEARAGLAYCWLEREDGRKALVYFNQLSERERHTPAVLVAEARAYRLVGDNRTALKLAVSVLEVDKENKLARKELDYLTGGGDRDVATAGQMPPAERPSNLVVAARLQSGFFEIFQDGQWKRIYINGVDIGPATPGHLASEAPTDTSVYLDWLDKIGKMGANCVRVYDVLPPGFYRALNQHNAAPNSAKLYLLQGIWLGGAGDTDVFSVSSEGEAHEQISRAIDVIHGHGDLPLRAGHAGGLYTADLSNYVLGFLLERDMPPHWVLANNRANSWATSCAGKYLTLDSGNATEAWLARMMDFAVAHEVDKYNSQHPLAFANTPALDPITHPSESSLAEEVAIRRGLGERTAAMPPSSDAIDDNDVVSVDETKFKTRPEFESGIFSAYSVYPFYPDFMYRDSSYLAVRDREGPDPFLGYLKALKSHYSGMALVVAEYGIPTSLGVSHIQPFGWSDGGVSERQQGVLLARMTRNIADAGCAGGVLFEWQDEWFRADWLAGAMALPADRRDLWDDRLDPDQGFGVWTYESGLSATLFSGFSGWDHVPRLYQKSAPPAIQLHDGWDSERTLRSLAVSSDQAFVYLRLGVGHLRRGANDLPNLEGAHYYIGISTDPGVFGGRILPGLAPQVRSQSGANFLLDLGEDGRARVLIASNYNPREFQTIFGTSAVQSSYRVPFTPTLGSWAGFEENSVEPNRRRFARDGQLFPAQFHDNSLLEYGPAPVAGGTTATWTCDFDHNAFIFRLPWGLLLVMDPSSHEVFGGTENGLRFKSVETKGLELFAASFRAIGPIHFQQLRGGGTPAVDTLPALDDHGAFKGLVTYRWPGWNAVNVQGRPKSAYVSMQKAFQGLRVPSP